MENFHNGCSRTLNESTAYAGGTYENKGRYSCRPILRILRSSSKPSFVRKGNSGTSSKRPTSCTSMNPTKWLEDNDYDVESEKLPVYDCVPVSVYKDDPASWHILTLRKCIKPKTALWLYLIKLTSKKKFGYSAFLYGLLEPHSLTLLFSAMAMKAEHEELRACHTLIDYI